MDIAIRDKQVSEAILSFDLIQARLEQIEDPKETAKKSSAIEATQASMDDTRLAVELKAKLVHLANDIGCLQSEYEDFTNTTALASGTARSHIEDVESTYRALNSYHR